MHRLVTKIHRWPALRRALLSPIAPVMVGVLLRLARLGAQDLWYDEAFTAWMSGLSWGSLMRAIAGDVHPPLWYAIEKVSACFLGNTVFALRLPAALCSIVALALLPGLAGALGLDRRVGVVATWIMALSPFQVAYAQEARMYSLLLLAVEASVLGVASGRMWLYALGALVALYTHNLGAVYVACIGLWGMTRVKSLPKLVVWSGGAAALYAPWLAAAMGQAADVGEDFWVQRPTWAAPLLALHKLFWHSTPPASLGVPCALLSGLALVAMFYKPGFCQKPGLYWLAFAPLAGTFAASLAWKPVLVVRTMIGCTPFLSLLLGQAFISHKRVKWLAIAAAPVLAGVLAGYYFVPEMQKGDMGKFIEPVLAQYRPGDAVFHTSVASYVLLSFYMPGCEHVLWRQANDLSQSLTDQTKDAMGMRQVESIDDLLALHKRVWGYWSDSPVTSRAETAEVQRIRSTYTFNFESLFPTDDVGLIESGVYLIGGLNDP